MKVHSDIPLALDEGATEYKPGLFKQWFIPTSLFGRSLLIVVIPLLILQVGLAYVFYDRHWSTISRWFSLALAGEVALAAEWIDEAGSETDRNDRMEQLRRTLGLSLSLDTEAQLETAIASISMSQQTSFHKLVEGYFHEKIDRPFALDLRVGDDGRRIAVYVQLEQGLLRILTERKRIATSTTSLLILWMIGLSVVVITLAIYFLRRQVYPIRHLAEAAESFGKGQDIGKFAPAGASEIRRAGKAFNAMRDRILRYVGQRTDMLAAVSHDLRSPIARMKLALDLTDMESDSREGLQGDLTDMERMLAAYLNFAKGDGNEKPTNVVLAALFEDVRMRAERRDIHLVIVDCPDSSMILRAEAMQRCLTNLVENAGKYARQKIELSAHYEKDQLIINVDDDGPGIPETERAEVFRAFYRLDQARKPGRGGVGLGLSIAGDIVAGHGGTIRLLDSPLGGLQVRIALPC